jgi:two-component system, sensor histidine kinase and response regulator
VIGAENGRIGLRLAREHLPNLIISDVMMPELDGYGVLEELRKDPVLATIPFIFLTARAERSDLRQGMDLGADDYLTKPFTRGDLLKAIEVRLAKQDSVESKFQKQLEDLRGSITLSLPHELRTPLTGILGFSSVLVESHDTLAGREILEMATIIQTSAERLYRLVENYLLYAELDILGLDPQKVAELRALKQTSDLHTVVAPVALHIARKAGREIDLNLDVQNAVVPILPAHLKKIAEELIDNAFKYSSAGTPVRVSGCADTREAGLIVVDQGRGMSPEQIAAIGAYMQFDRRVHEQQGSGLGLIVAKRLAELYGGSLTLDSLPDKGTTTRVTLPT